MNSSLTSIANSLLSGSCPGWAGLGCSRLGRKNRERGFPNQDAGLLIQKPRCPRWLVGSVADGHGGDLHCRSDHGSWLAVHSSADEWIELCRTSPGEQLSPATVFQALQSFPQFMTSRWASSTDKCRQLSPIKPAELADLPRTDIQALADDPRIAYGSTLLSACVSRDYLLAAQLGDGAIIEVDYRGEARFLIEPKNEYALNVTDSLCHRDAQHRFYTHVRSLSQYCPALLLLCTDGYVNAFADGEALLQSATEYLRLLTQRGPEYIANRLPTWLDETIEPYCSDDATLLLMYPTDS